MNYPENDALVDSSSLHARIRQGIADCQAKYIG